MHGMKEKNIAHIISPIWFPHDKFNKTVVDMVPLNKNRIENTSSFLLFSLTLAVDLITWTASIPLRMENGKGITKKKYVSPKWICMLKENVHKNFAIISRWGR